MVEQKSKQILTSAEVAEYLGVSRGYVYKLSHRRELPHSKPGGKLCFFRLEDVEAWATRNRIATLDEILAKARSTK